MRVSYSEIFLEGKSGEIDPFLAIFRTSDLVSQLKIEEFPAACLHGAIIYDKDRNIEQAMALEPHFVRDVSRLMRKHNKSTFLYVADSVAMVTKEENGSQDWEQVTRGFDPCVTDERDTDFMQTVLKGKSKIGKVSRTSSYLSDRSLTAFAHLKDVPSHGRERRSRIHRTHRKVFPRRRFQDHPCPSLHH